MKEISTSRPAILFLFLAMLSIQCQPEKEAIVSVEKGSHISLIGNNLCSRMMNFGYFETELYSRFPDSLLYIRNMCDGGNTAGFRPHSGRPIPWAFPGAEAFNEDLAENSNSIGHLETEDEWLSKHETDIIIAFFGYSESFNGPEGIDDFKNELTAFIDHTRSSKYNGVSAPELVLVSPIAFEKLSGDYDTPSGESQNENLELYTTAMTEVAQQKEIKLIDMFNPTKKWFAGSSNLTIDGSQLNDDGYEKFSVSLVNKIFGGSSVAADHWSLIHDAVKEKNWFWHNDYKMPNGVHAFGRRYDPFGPDNYPDEYTKLREMTSIRDSAIWMACRGETLDLKLADAQTKTLGEVTSNFKPGDYGRGDGVYLYGKEAEQTISVPEGYKIELFASEEEFSDLANPVQLSFDNKGRLWVAVMPTYPHWKPGDPKPNDKLIILEDTDGDFKADKQTTFVDGLHIPVGFEFAPEGVYISQGTNLKLYTDTDGDDKADTEEIIMSGFDDHDTHHVISAFCADPSGAIYMGEGVFLHTNVETSYGPVRGTNGGFYRYAPQRRHLERTAQLSIPNPWGIAFDEWGQPIFAETSGPSVRWMLPGTVKSRYGVATHKSKELIKDEHKVRPTSGLEFIHSRHFPDEVQGDMLINNSIGFLGAKQHQFKGSGTGFETDLRHDLMESTDRNFRPVDMEIAPDGSLYVVDWHNVLIGHMQHNARDPYRDHVHGRIYRITYPSRPLVKPAKIVDASIAELLDNLKLPEYRSRYRTRRELRARNTNNVVTGLETWIANLDKDDADYEHHLVEAMWVYWGINRINEDLLQSVLTADDFRARAAGVRVLRYNGHLLDEDQQSLLMEAASDDHGRVRLEAIVAASWLENDNAMSILTEAGKYPLDEWMVHAHQTAVAHVNGVSIVKEKSTDDIPKELTEAEIAVYNAGKDLYLEDGYCGTCHQPNGKGLAATGYPPLAGARWVTGKPERLIKLVLKGLYGPIRVKSVDYSGTVPMTPYEGLMDDEEIAAVLSYVRKSFGNTASMISPDLVKEVRESIIDKKGFYTPEELLNEHPF